jgi:DNA-binding NtrC family response regulator
MQKFFLIIDPDQSLGEPPVVQQALAGIRGAEVVLVSNAEAAMDLLEERRVVPSLVFCTLELPGMSGLDFLGEVRRRRWLERTPVAIMSKSATDRQVVQAYRLGASTFLAKPLRPFEVRDAIREFGSAAVPMRSGTVVGGVPGGRSVSAA